MDDIAHGESDGRIKKRIFKLRHIEKLQPLIWTDTLTAAKGPVAALEGGQVKKIESRKYIAQNISDGSDDSTLGFATAIGFLQKIHESLVFEHVTISIDELLFQMHLHEILPTD